jgi:hypothetical protein
MPTLLQWFQIIHRSAVENNHDADREDQSARLRGRAADALGTTRAMIPPLPTVAHRQRHLARSRVLPFC